MSSLENTNFDPSVRELIAKHVDYTIDSILFAKAGDQEGLKVSQERIREIEEQVKIRMEMRKKSLS